LAAEFHTGHVNSISKNYYGRLSISGKALEPFQSAQNSEWLWGTLDLLPVGSEDFSLGLKWA
jgi:hypothetical protein